MQEPLRVYADTSVFGGAQDPEFRELSLPFFDRVCEGAVQLVVSALVIDELEEAPNSVRAFFAELAPRMLRVEIGAEAYALQQGYMKACIVGPRWETDAMHVAVATVSGCAAIVSWNFKHIVNFRRIPLYNEVNRAMGYGPVAIHTPPEVTSDEED